MPFMKLNLAALIATALIVPAVQAQRDPMLYVSSSNDQHWSMWGPRAHTNVMVYLGDPQFPSNEAPLLALSGPSAFGAGPSGYTPNKIRTAYNLPSFGGSKTIAIIDAYHYPSALNDFNVFSQQFGLPTEPSATATANANSTFQVVYASGSKPAVNAGWSQEAALDIEWAHAMAPGAKIILVEAASSSLNDLANAVRKANTIPGVSQVSMSWGSGEYPVETYFDSIFTGANITYFASAGDRGGLAEFPSVSPKVVSVGGTTLQTDSNGNVTSETAWAGSGGGPSVYEPRPAYQQHAGFIGVHRAGPDVAFVANPYTGVAVYDSTPAGGYSGWMVFGGTSVSAPCIAGITNLAAHFRASGNAQLTFTYNGLGGANFRDVASGSAGKFTAGRGWDYITGVGSPVGLGGM